MAVILFPRKKIFKHTIHFARKFNLPLKRAATPHAFMHNNVLKYYFCKQHLLQKNWNIKNTVTDIKDFYYLFQKFRNEVGNYEKRVLQLLEHKNISEECLRFFLLPFASLYMSMPYHALFDLPLSIIAKWWDKYTSPFYSIPSYSYIEGGNHKLINAFIANTNLQYKLNTKVKKLQRCNKKVTVMYDDRKDEFDKVIIATRPDEALDLLESPTFNERQILSSVQVGKLCSTLHTASNFSHKGAITLNVRDKDKCEPTLLTTWGQNTCFGYDLTREHYISIHEINENPIPEEYIIRQEHFRVPLPTAVSLKYLTKVNTLNANSLNTYFCGSYFNSFFYHEDALESSIAVAAHDLQIRQ